MLPPDGAVCTDHALDVDYFKTITTIMVTKAGDACLAKVACSEEVDSKFGRPVARYGSRSLSRCAAFFVAE